MGSIGQLGKAVELGDSIKAHVESLSSEEKTALGNLSMPASGPTFSLENLRQVAEQPLQNMLPTVTKHEAEFLFYMRMTILCTSNHTGFITSDAPVVLVDPELHKMPPFYRKLTLGSPTIEVTMPIAPSRLVLFTHNEKLAEGYLPIPSTLQLGMDLIDENNRRRRFHCNEHFVSNSSEKKEIWFAPGTPPPSSP